MLAAIASGGTASAQANRAAQNGLPDDWTHHRVVFSDPGAEQDAIRKGRHDHWLKVTNSQRYRLQQIRRERQRHGWDGHWGNHPPAVKLDWSMNLGSGATVGSGQYPVKFNFSATSVSCNDWVAYNTGIAGASGGQANIVAYSNLYTGTCTGSTPTVLWAYASGSGSALTSPVVSLDGSKIAFIENTSGGAILRIIQWAANEGSASAAATPDAAYTNTTAGAGGNTAWSSCAAGSSCMISVAFQNGQQDTISAPFYDYDGSDTLWVGDASGKLHKFTGVFSGTPAEVVTNWPVNVVTETTTGLSPAPINPTNLTGPVYDSASTLIFLGDGAGYLHSVTSTGTPTVSTTANRMACDTSGFVDPPLVDSTTEEVYDFVGYGCSSPNQAYVNRFTASTSTPISSQSYGNAYQGLTASGSSASVLRAGTFDNAYFSGSGATGNLYVCAAGTLIQLPLSKFANTTGTNYNVYNTPVSGTTACSPVSEFENGSTDWLFLSVAANGNTTANGITCMGACMYNYNVTSGATSGTPTYGMSEAGGTSGIVIDNNGSAAGESQVYFSTLAAQSCPGNGSTGSGTGGCAIQTAQAGPPAAATPAISPNGGTFTSSQTVTITDSTSGATIYYSTGSGFAQYTGQFSVSSSETVQAYADAAGYTQSPTASASFTISSGTPPTVTVTPRNAGLTITQTTSVKATTSDSSSVNWTATGTGCSGSACGTFSATTSASGTAVTYTAPSTAGVYTITATSVANSLGFASSTVGVTDLVGVTTYHNDLSRDGVNAQEYALTPSNVGSSTFGKVFSCAVDGYIYAQPLWMANLTISGAMHNVVLVATENDSLYAFDADKTTCTTLWHANLIDTSHGAASGETAVPYTKVGNASGNIKPVIGITGTPVIDPSTDILYVVTKSIDTSNNMYQRIHAINLLNGNEAISGSPVTMAGTYPKTSGSVAFVAQQENQRPGLALVNGVVYVAYAAHEDKSPWYGWVFGYSASTLSLSSIFNTTPNGSVTLGGEGGIWMGGSAPAADSSGNLYVITGNGTFDANSLTAPNNDYGDSFLQLSPTLTVSQYFTPDDQASDQANDKDVGGGGATVVVNLPVNGSLPNQLVLGGGKDQLLYLVNRAAMGGYSGTSNVNVQTLSLSGSMFATPVYWNGSFYFASNHTKLQQYTLNMSTYQINVSPASSSSTTYNTEGATPSLTTNPAGTTAILWAQDNNVSPPVVHAYNASSLTTDLWNSSGATGGAPVKFSLPTVADGKVYVGTASELDVYGLLP